MRLVQCYPGRGFEEGIAEVVNARLFSSVVGRYHPLVDPGVVVDWFRGDYEPESFAAIVEDRRVYGFGWAWVNVEEGPAPVGFVSVSWDPRLPSGDVFRVLYMLLSWARHSLEGWQDVRGVVAVRVGGLEVLEPVARVLRVSPGEARVRLLLMEAPGRISYGGSVGVEVVEVRPDRDPVVLEALVDIFNDAFSVYEGFWPWSVDRARRYYERLYRERRALTLFAYLGGVPVGFVEASLHRSASGDIVGEVGLLAVRRQWQGRGIGGFLLARAVEWLYREGATRVYLDATPEASRLYSKMGFRTVYEYLQLRLPLASLPQAGLDGVHVWDPGSCPGVG